jgi:trans-aconitate methyltransferase
MEKKDIKNWYNEFAEKQIQTGVNYRNKMIEKWLLKFGLKPYHKVLEIGCGIGTQTELLAKYLKNGNITANDISDKSIEFAKMRLKNYNINWLIGDIIELDIDNKYDYILLPDVIEHIPIDDHYHLFKKLSNLLAPNGKIVIHIPFPYYIEWLHINQPQLLQVIDQAIHLNHISQVFSRNNLYISFLHSYSIWNFSPDYQIIVLNKINDLDYSKKYDKNENIKKRIHRKIVKFLNFIFNEKEFDPFI